MKWLLFCVPPALFLGLYDGNSLLVFALSLAAIIPLVELMGDATEHIAAKLGSTAGGLLNTTLANTPELIIGLVALSNGLGSVVKASLTGSVLVNLLVGMGIALVWGGSKYGPQRLERKKLRSNGSMLLICAFCLIVPAVFKIGTPDGTRGLSTEISVVLLCIYFVNVLVTLYTHQTILDQHPRSEIEEAIVEPQPSWPMHTSVAVLTISAVLLGFVSESLSNSLSPSAAQLGLSITFSGIVLLGGVGGIGEVLAALRFARAGKPSLVLSSTVGSTIQLVLMVAPLLVFAGLLLGQPMDLCFTSFEVVAIVLAVVITKELIEDGESSWFEGVLLLGMYIILSIGFFHLPDSVADAEQAQSMKETISLQSIP